MPKEFEKKLQLEATKKGYARGSKKYGAYVYGTLQKKTDWKPGKK